MEPLTDATTFDKNLQLLSQLQPHISPECIRQCAMHYCGNHQYVLQRFLLIACNDEQQNDPDVQGNDWVARSSRSRSLRTFAFMLSSLAAVLPVSRISLQQAMSLTNIARQLHDCLKLYDNVDRPSFATQRESMVLSIKVCC
jgi:hypothetical protein